MAANRNADDRADYGTDSTMDHEQKIGDMEMSGEEEFSFAHFERQWRRYLTNFERRRLQYADFYSGHKATLYGLDPNCGEQQDMQQIDFQYALDAAASALYDVQNTLGVGKFCCNCNCKCKAEEPQGRRPLSSTPR